MSEEFLEAMNEDMDSALDALARSLNTVRTGRASPALIEGVQVDVSSYGARMPLNQLATISAPDPRLLVVSPWDKTTLSDIEKAITVAGLGLNPSSDGSIIRVPILRSPASAAGKLARLVGKYAEEAKVQVRRVRKEYNDTFKQMETDKEISEDELKRLFKKVQDATDESVAKVDAAAKAKEKEISEV